MKLKQGIQAVFFGLITIFIAGFLLFTLSDLTIKKYFLTRSDNTVNSFIVDLSEFLWGAIAAFLGGYVTAAIAFAKPAYSLITGITAFIIIGVLGLHWNNLSLQVLFFAVNLVLFSFIGGVARKYYFNRK